MKSLIFIVAVGVVAAQRGGQRPLQGQFQQVQAAPRRSILQEGERDNSTTPVPILRNNQHVDPVTGAFIYDYLGADGSGKYEVRFPNGTVIGNFTFVNGEGVQETRWYSAGVRGTEISGDGVVSPAPPTLVDETTGENYVDLGNYELYRHLEEPYVHIAGVSSPDERGQLTSPDSRRSGARRTAQQQRPQPQQQQQQRPQPQQQQQQQQQRPQPVPQSVVPLDHLDQSAFRAAPQRPRARVRPQQARPVPRPIQTNVQFNHRAIDGSSPNSVLDSLIGQFN